MKIKQLTLSVILIVLAIAAPLFRSATAAVARIPAETEWFFVVIETRVHAKNVEIDDKHPEERRWYISEMTALPDNIPSYSAPKKVNEYFDANVVSPAEKRGVVVEYYDQDSQINGGSVLAIGSREQGEEMRQKDIQDRKEQGGNIYSFNIVIGATKGDETSQPKLIYRNKQQPSYEGARKP